MHLHTSWKFISLWFSTFSFFQTTTISHVIHCFKPTDNLLNSLYFIVSLPSHFGFSANFFPVTFFIFVVVVVVEFVGVFVLILSSFFSSHCSLNHTNTFSVCICTLTVTTIYYYPLWKPLMFSTTKNYAHIDVTLPLFSLHHLCIVAAAAAAATTRSRFLIFPCYSI